MNDPRPPIVVCYDGSPDAARAVKAAGNLFPGQPAIVVYIWPGVAREHVRTTSVETVRTELIEEARVAARREATAVAEEGTSLARRAGLDARPLAIEAANATADAIRQVAADESALAVIVGRRRGAPLGHLLHGSVSATLVDRAPMPVVVV